MCIKKAGQVHERRVEPKVGNKSTIDKYHRSQVGSKGRSLVDVTHVGIVMRHGRILMVTAVLFIGLLPCAQAEEGIPTPPLNLITEGGDGHVNLTWEHPNGLDPADIVSYWIYWVGMNTIGGGLYTYPQANDTYLWTGMSSPGNSTAVTISGLTNGLTYFFHVRAHTEDAEGEPSTVRAAKPRRLPSEPRFLTGSLDEGTVLLEWLPPEITGDAIIYAYRVLRGSTPSTLEKIATLEWDWMDWGLYQPPPTNYTDDDLQGKRVWYYQVVAVNSLGEGPPSDTVLVGEADQIPLKPGIPRDTKAYVQNGHIKIFWRPPGYNGGEEVVKYRIYRWCNGQVARAIGEVPHDHLSFLDVHADPGVEYLYAVSAINVVGEGPRGLEVTAFVHPSTVDEPDEPTTAGSSEGPWEHVTLLIVAVTTIACAMIIAYLALVRSKGRR